MNLDAVLAAAQRALVEGEEEETPVVAGVSLALARIHTQVDQALEPLKKLLRERAAELRADPSLQTVQINGVWDEALQGTVAVTFPVASLRISPKADLTSLRKQLGEEVFSRYFEEVVTYKVRKDFGHQLAAQAGGQLLPEINLVLAAVENTENTPRVAFRPLSVPSPTGLWDMDPEAP